MGIILFLVDTSASMNQKTYLGTSCLDVAKVAIETFMKVGWLAEVELPVLEEVTLVSCALFPMTVHTPPPCTVSYEGPGQQRGPVYVGVF